ncbi:MAG: ParA family protein [Pseudomonadota bacterium]
MGYVISFAQQKGGAGKTTALLHLAEAWRLSGKSVGLLDLDPQRTLMSWAEEGGAPGLSVMESAGWRSGTDVRAAAKTYDIVLVDCPGNASSLLEAALRESDLVLVPCQPTGPDVWATTAVLKMAAAARTPARVLLNRVPARGGSTAEAVIKLKQAGATILTSRLGNRVAYSAGLLDGRTAFGIARASVATREVEAARVEIDHVLAAL